MSSSDEVELDEADSRKTFLCPLAAIGALVRHEVFNTLSNGLVNFDVPPVFFWSLTTYLDNTGFTAEATSDDNPDWLNRFVLRLVETEAAVVFQLPTWRRHRQPKTKICRRAGLDIRAVVLGFAYANS